MTETKQIPQFVTPDMTIGEAVMRYPVTAEIMLSYGLHCVGCHVSGIESIRQGAMGHGGMDDEDVEMLVQEMNEAIAEKESATSSDQPLVITKKAAQKIKEFAEDEAGDDLFLRVGITPGGCAGFNYLLDFDTEKQENDIQLEADGFPVRMAEDSLEFLNGAILDYVDGLNGSGFKFDNPNAQQGCGCGKSFS